MKALRPMRIAPLALALLLPVCSRPEKVYRAVPAGEGAWTRQREIVHVPLEMLEVGLPAGVSPADVREFAVVYNSGRNTYRVPHQVHRINGRREWEHRAARNAATHELVFPLWGLGGSVPWRDDKRFDGHVQLRLWDSEQFAVREGLRLHYRTRSGPASPFPVPTLPMELKRDSSGFMALLNGKSVVHFSVAKNYQIDRAYAPGTSTNLVPEGSVWRWALSGSLTDSRGGPESETVEFTPIITRGLELVVHVRARSSVGEMTSLMRIFPSGEAVVVRFDAYRSRRAIREPGLQNDDEFAYVLVSTNDPKWRPLLEGGLVVWLDPNGVPTMGEYFRTAGYRTFWKGKWHVTHADLLQPGLGQALQRQQRAVVDQPLPQAQSRPQPVLRQQRQAGAEQQQQQPP